MRKSANPRRPEGGAAKPASLLYLEPEERRDYRGALFVFRVEPNAAKALDRSYKFIAEAHKRLSFALTAGVQRLCNIPRD